MSLSTYIDRPGDSETLMRRTAPLPTPVGHHFNRQFHLGADQKPCWRRLRAAADGLVVLFASVAMLYGLGLALFIGASGVMGWLS